MLATRYPSWRLLLNSLYLVLLSWSINAFATATSLTIKDSAPKTYTVVKGDTLWDISALYLDSPWLWPRLWQANPDINNPHLIYPSDQLTLIWRDGQPVLSRKPMLRLSPQARVTARQPLPIVEQHLILPYLVADRLMTPTELDSSLKIIGSQQGNQYLSQQDSLYIAGQHEASHWAIYRPMNSFVTEQQTMIGLRLLATAHQVDSSSTLTTLAIDQFNQEIRANDIALPEITLDSLNLTTHFLPTPAPAGLHSRLLGTLEGSQYAAKHHVVVIEHGQQAGLVQGSMFELYQAGHTVYQTGDQFSDTPRRSSQAIQLPAKKVGELMVIRPYPNMSLALITTSQVAIDEQISIVAPHSSDTSVEQRIALNP